MKLTPYSSVSAFVAHARALNAANQGTTGNGDAGGSAMTTDALNEINDVLSGLSAVEREALGVAQSAPTSHHLASDGCSAAAGHPSDAASRRRARAELKLHHALVALGLLAD
jgi:hypothetical protein